MNCVPHFYMLVPEENLKRGLEVKTAKPIFQNKVLKRIQALNPFHFFFSLSSKNRKLYL